MSAAGRVGHGPAAGIVRSSQASVLRDEVATVTPHEVTAVSPSLDGLVGIVTMPTSHLVFVRYGGNVLVEAPPTGSRPIHQPQPSWNKTRPAMVQ